MKFVFWSGSEYMDNGILKKRPWVIVWWGFILLVGCFAIARVEADEARFIYDSLGRLQAVIDSNGNAAIYNYDAVGNLLSITRTGAAPTGVSITFFSPDEGPVGTEVTIYGAGFSPTPADNDVKFNGVTASVISSTNTQIVASVPTGATTGPISVTNSNGNVTSATPFTVTLPLSIEVSPATAVVVSGTSKQFTASVEGTTNQSVTWSIDGVGTTVGSISDTGLYSVPSSFAGTALVLVKATSLVDPTKSATASVSVLPSAILSPIVAPQVSVAVAAPPLPLVPTGPFVAPQVSVEVAEPPPTPVVSGPFIAPQVSVEVAEPPPTPVVSGPFVAPQVSVALTPIISAISPSSGAQGATNLLITITGTGLMGATSISFLLNGVTDTSITATNITANAEGIQVTADFTITSSAPIGFRVVRIITPNGTSPSSVLGGNTFSVTAP
jgi:YD repeat-containing protein